MREPAGRQLRAVIAATLAAAGLAHAQGPAGVQAARVTGVVFDSMTMRPLTGAVVQLALVPAPGTIDRVRSVVTDSLGRYDFADIPLGTYLLGFQHVAVDSLGLRGPLQRIDVRTASIVRAPMAVPSMLSIIRTVCGRDGVKDSLAALLGSVRHARNDTPLPGAFVSLRWGEVLLGRGGSMQRSTPIVDTFANDEGWFTACVPGGVQMTLRATNGTDLSGNVELGVPAHAVLRRDIYVGPSQAEVRGPDSLGSAREREERIVDRGVGELRGTVRALDGQPIANARVALLTGTGETLTNARGEFVLAGLPLGTHTIEARAIGYVPGQELADIVEFKEAVAQFVLLDVSAYLLDTVRVAAARRLDAAVREGFERRRKSGVGYFVDESVLDTLKAITFKDLVRRHSFIRFVRGNTLETSWREHIEFMGRTGAPCVPVIYLDGTQLLGGQTDLDVIIHPASVRRIEIYQSGLALPAEFASNRDCGVLAVWTGARRQRQ
jgi:hypothetical protein